MPFVIGPGTFKMQTALSSGLYSAALLPPYASPVPVVTGGTPLAFDAADQTREVEVPIPRLAGLDDIELDRVAFDLWSFAQEDEVSVGGNPSGGAVTLALDSAAGATVRLLRIEIDDLRVTAAAGAPFVLAGGGGAGSLSHVVYERDADGETKAHPNGTPGVGIVQHLHLLVRTPSGSGFGPPAAAAPHFAMPGAGAALYGPALGGVSFSLFDAGSGKIRAVLRLLPPLAGSRFSLLIGHAAKPSAHEGLPNEVAAVTWSAQSVVGVFDVRPARVTVKGAAAAAGADQPVVAEFPSDPGDAPVAVDFSGVARSLLKKAYPASQGADLGLKLLFTAGSPGELRVRLGQASARYISRPLDGNPATIALQGAPGTIDLAVSDEFRPAALSFTLDGIYGPARLTLDSDTATPDARHGLRVAGSVQVARLVALTAAETNLPLARLGLFGRASEPSELLLSLHSGDQLRIGPPVAEPLSLEVEPSPTPAWHRQTYAAPGRLPPHRGLLWLVVRVTRGVFWWHGAPDGDGSTQRSADDGSTFAQVAGRPMLHVSVTEVDSATGHPTPAFPVSLRWSEGLLNADIVGVAGQEASLPPEFRRFWIADGSAHAPFFSRVPELGGLLRLTFACQRDVDLTVSDVVLTFDPWNA